MRRPTAMNLIAVWLLAILLCYLFVDRPAADLAHRIGRHAITEALTRLPEYLTPAFAVLVPGLGLVALRWSVTGIPRQALLAGLGLIVANALNAVLKAAFGRTWPETWIADNPSYIGTHAYGFHPFHGGQGWASFPSGHMTAIAAFCGVLWFSAPRLRVLWAAIVASVAIGLFGQDFHFVSDMLAGTGEGFAVAYGVVRLASRPASADR